jgi:hypothetical protein
MFFIIPSFSNKLRKNIAPRIIIKISKAIKIPLPKEVHIRCGSIFQYKITNTVYSASVTVEAISREVRLTRSKIIKTKRGMIDRIVGKCDVIKSM